MTYFGVVFPQTEYGNDPIAIKDYVQIAEGLGFSHIIAYDHVLGANPDRPDGWKGPYSYKSPFHEPFTLFSFMASVSQKIRFTTSIIILPQRQTALVAKQSATLDVLSGGRLRLGVGIGWNPVEYVALNENFHDRGKRIEEQVDVLRRLWTQPLVTYEGRWHSVPDAGINPLPIQRPIQIWFGGHAEPVLERVAKLGDGWMPGYRKATDARASLDRIKHYLDKYNRDQSNFGLEARLLYGDGDPSNWITMVKEWAALGANYLSVNTMGSGFTTTNDHINAIRRFAQTFLSQ